MVENNLANTSIPVYNIKAISTMVGLLPVTLRAWERRYGLLHPIRGDQGYRLYTDYDLRTLRWVKNQIETGMSISRAVDHLNDLREKGQDPADEIKHSLANNSVAEQNISNQLLTSVTSFNDNAAHETLRRAFAIYSVDQVLTRVITPTLVKIGEAWHKGELPIAIEHYATQFFMQHLMSMLTTTMPPSHTATIFAGGAPGEQHQIGLLMLVVMLRWRGWDIKYLGPDVSFEGLHSAMETMQPRMFLFSATREEHAKELIISKNVFLSFPDPKPLLIIGGQGFENVKIPSDFPGRYIKGTPEEIVNQIEGILTGLPSLHFHTVKAT